MIKEEMSLFLKRQEQLPYFSRTEKKNREVVKWDLFTFFLLH